MKPQERDSVLMIDEVSLMLGIDFDSFSGNIIGYPTLRSAYGQVQDRPASHALVFMLGGLTTRWEQCIGYFTGESYEATSVRVYFQFNKEMFLHWNKYHSSCVRHG